MTLARELAASHLPPVAVHLEGHGTFWWMKNTDGSGALAPREHCSEVGQLHTEAMFADSYAHVFANGLIKRYGQVIAHRDNLKVMP